MFVEMVQSLAYSPWMGMFLTVLFFLAFILTARTVIKQAKKLEQLEAIQPQPPQSTAMRCVQCGYVADDALIQLEPS